MSNHDSPQSGSDSAALVSAVLPEISALIESACHRVVATASLELVPSTGTSTGRQVGQDMRIRSSRISLSTSPGNTDGDLPRRVSGTCAGFIARSKFSGQCLDNYKTLILLILNPMTR